jgi:outer membrane protein assembly factor BamB
MNRYLRLVALVIVCLVAWNHAPLTAADAAPAEIDPLDWPQWRGPQQNGISLEVGLIDDWDLDKGPEGNVLWKNEEVAGRSTPIVMRGKLYSIVRADPGTPLEGEKVVCLDAVTGEKLWENRFNVFLSDVPDTRVGWSNCAGDPETGRVYALGVCGYFQCLDGETGETIWSHSMSEEYGLLSTYGGRTNTPVIVDDLVIISAVIIGWGEMAKPTHRFVAFDKNTGEVVWFNGTRPLPDDTTYSTPFVTTLDGQKAIVFGSGDGAVWAFQPRTGVPIWNYQLSRRGLNTSPIVVDDRVYMGHSEENSGATLPTMGSLIALDATAKGEIPHGQELWKHDEVMVGRCAPLLVDGRLYVVEDRGSMYVYDAQSGEQVGRRVTLAGSSAQSSPIYFDGKILVCTSSAWHLFEPTEKGVKMIKRARAIRGEEFYASPVVSHGRIYLLTTGGTYCLGSKTAETSSKPLPPSAKETPVKSDDKPAHVQLVPAESLIRPGEQIKYKVRFFNDRGQFLRESQATFELEGSGEISDSGTFTASSVPRHSATLVNATVGDLSGSARVRVVPPLPWKFDFSDGEVPVTWVGARYRHVTREIDGNTQMVKVTTIPKGTRSQSWMGHTDLHDYTIQADVRGAIKDEKMPDIGLIAQRYTLDLMGASQQLQIRTWTPQLRMAKTVPFAWEPNVDYVMKFRAAVEDGKAVLRGKVWKKSQPEPDAWTVEAVDPTPSVMGSPGLFGNAKDAEIYFDNITVTPNE